MQRSTRLSTILFAVILSPAMLQSDCNPGGTVSATELLLLELEAGGQDRVVGFASTKFLYEVWVPAPHDVVTVHAQSVDTSSPLSVTYQGVEHSIGDGIGEIDLDLAFGLSTVVVSVAAPGGAVRTYEMHVTRDFAPGPCNFGAPHSRVITAGCAVIETTEGIAQPILAYELSVDAGPILGGQPFTAELGGVAIVDEFILDVFQAPTIVGGSQQVELFDIVATVQVRSGATGPDVPLAVDVSALVPGPTGLCAIVPSSTTVCDPANDVDALDPSAGNTDCQPVFAGNSCNLVNLVDLPISTDGPTCTALGPTKEDQFLRNSFCVTGPLSIPLATQTASYTADASGEEVLWGWADQGIPGLVLCPDLSEPRCESNGGTVPDGTYAIPVAGASVPAGPLGLRMHNAGLVVPQNCAMATQSVDSFDAPIPNVVEPTPDADLIACTIHPPECSNDGECSSLCVDGICTIPEPGLVSVDIDLCCNNNASLQQTIIPARLDVGLSAVVVGGAFAANLSGLWTFPESLLDTAQMVVPAGVQETDLQALQATVVVRAGATGPPVALPAILPPSTCLIGGTACDKANDVSGNGNTDCLPQGSFNPCQSLLTVPISTDPTVCASLDPPGCTVGVDCTKTDQRNLNGFCVTGPLPIPLELVVGNYTAGASGETIVFGWDDQNTAATFDGTFWTVPTPAFTDPLGPNGLKVNASGLGVAIDCVMGIENGDLLTDPVTCGLTPDSALVGFLIP